MEGVRQLHSQSATTRGSHVSGAVLYSVWLLRSSGMGWTDPLLHSILLRGVVGWIHPPGDIYQRFGTSPCLQNERTDTFLIDDVIMCLQGRHMVAAGFRVRWRLRLQPAMFHGLQVDLLEPSLN